MSLNYLVEKNKLNIILSGNYIQYKNFEEKEEILNLANKNDIKVINFNAENLKKWDSSLAVIIFKLVKISKERQININLDKLPENVKSLIKLAFSVDRKPNTKNKTEESFFENIGNSFLNSVNSCKKGFLFLKISLLSLKNFIFSKAVMRVDDFLMSLENCSYKAVPIVSLISFMVGLILAFVGSIQLKAFGAEIYVASLVSIAMVRIMGAVMTAIIMAGRTGANYAATIGTMQVNEEIDALKTMGIPVVDFLLLPRILSLIITMPFLTLISNIVGIIGGGFVGIFILNIPPQKYYQMSIDVLDLNNFSIGIFHGLVFGIIIALCGCYYGINCGKDSDGVGKATTKSVVSSIVWIIISTGIITLICEVFGI